MLFQHQSGHVKFVYDLEKKILTIEIKILELFGDEYTNFEKIDMVLEKSDQINRKNACVLRPWNGLFSKRL